MSKTVEFVIIFDDGVRKRHHHRTENGVVAYFAVQLEVMIKDEWKVVIRYDCSHGFSHMHRYDIMGKEIKKMLHLNFESALTFGDWDIGENWQKYVKKFLGGNNEKI
jgi:hypothetical protein